MVKQLDVFIKKLDQISNLLNCKKCDKCEKDVIYLLPIEIEKFKNLKIPLTQIDGIYYLQKNGEYCPFRDIKEKNCSIYPKRPICCRMFPLDISSIRGLLEWVVYDYCPKVRNEQGKPLRDALSIYSMEIENCFTKELLDFYYKEHITTTKIESMGKVKYETLFLRPVGEAQKSIIKPKYKYLTPIFANT